MSSLPLHIAIATAILILLQKLLSARKRHAFAQQHGCLPVNKYPHVHALGWDLYRARANAVAAGRRNGYDLELFEQCGPTYEERQFTRRVIHTTQTENFQAVGATQFQQFGRDGSGRRAMRPFFGDGILSMDGSEWRQARDLVTPLFVRAQLRDVEFFRSFVDRMFDLLPRDGSTVDMQPLLQKLFLDSSTEFIFGQSIDSLRDKTGASQEFLNAFNLALAGAGKRANSGGVFAFTSMFDKSWEKQYSKVHAFIDEAIARNTNRSVEKDSTESDFRQRYVLIDGMVKEIHDPVELRFQLLNIFFPARDTSAIAVSNTLFCLARNPHLWKELRAEALKLGDQPLTFELLKSLQPFRYALFEALRLYGPSGQIRRVALRDTVLPKGGGSDASAPVFVPRGTRVYLNTFPKNRDPNIWGEDVEAFRPSRFEGKVLTWEFTPFFGGPRICPAVNQVIAQSIYVLVRLVTEFETIENRDECFEYVEATRMLVESRNGIKIALHPAKG